MKPSYDPDEPYAAETWADEERQRRIDESIEQQPASGIKERRENHPNRQVHRGRFPHTGTEY